MKAVGEHSTPNTEHRTGSGTIGWRGIRSSVLNCASFPLTPALSLGERENWVLLWSRLPRFDCFTNFSGLFPLLGERAGVREM
jgi:hypothetical protein